MSVDEYSEWLCSPESGLHAEVHRSGMTYSLTVLPHCWRVLRDSSVTDMVVARVRVTSQSGGLPDASFEGVTSLGEYSQRMADLSFHWADLVELWSGDSVIHVAGSQLVQTQGLRQSVDVYLTLACTEDALANMQDCHVLFKDDIFHHGLIRWDLRPVNIQRVQPRHM